MHRDRRDASPPSRSSSRRRPERERDYEDRRTRTSDREEPRRRKRSPSPAPRRTASSRRDSDESGNAWPQTHRLTHAQMAQSRAEHEHSISYGEENHD